MVGVIDDAVIISDLHLGSEVCQARELCDFLDGVRARRLILAGDVFDSLDFRRLRKHHWGVLSKIRSMSDETEVVWINGNHDGSAEIVSHLLGTPVVDEYVFTTGGLKVLVLHGHVFDRFIADHPFLTRAGDWFYRTLQRLDTSHTWARVAKHSSKQYLRCRQQIKDSAVEYARRCGCDVVVCGHVHAAEEDVGKGYYNCGCWTEKPQHYLTVRGGQIKLHVWQ